MHTHQEIEIGDCFPSHVNAAAIGVWHGIIYVKSWLILQACRIHIVFYWNPIGIYWSPSTGSRCRMVTGLPTAPTSHILGESTHTSMYNQTGQWIMHIQYKYNSTTELLKIMILTQNSKSSQQNCTKINSTFYRWGSLTLHLMKWTPVHKSICYGLIDLLAFKVL